MIRIVLLILIFFPSMLLGDIIHLRGGNHIEGYFLSMDGEFMVFKTFEGEVRIFEDEILRVEMGYSGIPMCYGEEEEEPVCGGLLHAASKKGITFVADRGTLVRQTLPPESFDFITFTKESPEQKIIPMLETGLGFEVKTWKGPVSGRIIRIQGSSIEIRDEVTGETEFLREGDIREGEVRILPEPRPTREEQIGKGFNLLQLLPGFYQFERGEYWKSGFIVGGLALLELGMITEYRAASVQDNRAMNDPAFLLFANSAYRTEFERHQQNQMMIGASMLALYAYHLYDAGFYEVVLDSPGSGEQASVTAGPGRCGPRLHSQEWKTDWEAYCSVELRIRF